MCNQRSSIKREGETQTKSSVDYTQLDAQRTRKVVVWIIQILKKTNDIYIVRLRMWGWTGDPSGRAALSLCIYI